MTPPLRQMIKLDSKFNGFRHAHPVKIALTDHDGDPDLLVQSSTDCYTPAPTFRNFLYRYGMCKCEEYALDWGSEYD